MSDQDYDIQEAFRRIELELIASMKRNLSKHQEWETKEGINWNMWQAEQLKDMRRFQQQNEKIFGKRFVQINNRVQNLLKETAGLQDFEQERQSLEEMINNPSLSRSSSEAISGGFFGINDRRMMALIKSTGNDLKKAEHAMLRMTNDQYRKVIFNAQTYFNSGAGTLDKAIDMATDEFLKRGINCIEYKDGRRVNIATYAEMALRTANKRAGLMADGDKRAAMGIHLVKISSYGACSPTCMPWQGRIYVDDVYSGGTKEEAKELGYPLLSKALEGGLFHPNCRHTASTYYPGLDLNDTGNPRDDSKTVDLKEHPDAERYHNYYQNLIQREKRLQVGSLDEAKIREHADRETELVELDNKAVEKFNRYSAPLKGNVLQSRMVHAKTGDTSIKDYLDEKRKDEWFNKHFKRIAEEYADKAHPKVGELTIDPKLLIGRIRDELNVRNILFDAYGGNIRCLNKDLYEGYSPDYIWDNFLWELKTPESFNGVRRLTEKGIKQINSGVHGLAAGGIVLDLSKIEVPITTAIDSAIIKIARQSPTSMDLIVIKNDAIVTVIRYIK